LEVEKGVVSFAYCTGYNFDVMEPMTYTPPEEPHLRGIIFHARRLWADGQKDHATRFYRYAEVINREINAYNEVRLGYYRPLSYIDPLMIEAKLILGKDAEIFAILKTKDPVFERKYYAREIVNAYRWIGKAPEAEAVIHQENLHEDDLFTGKSYVEIEREVLDHAAAGEWEAMESALVKLQNAPLKAEYQHHPASIRALAATVVWSKGEVERANTLWQQALDKIRQEGKHFQSEVLAFIAEEWATDDRNKSLEVFREAVERINDVRSYDQEKVASYVYARLIGAGFTQQAQKLKEQLPYKHYADRLANAHQLRRLRPLAMVSEGKARELRAVFHQCEQTISYEEEYAQTAYVLARYGNFSLEEKYEDRKRLIAQSRKGFVGAYAKGLFEREASIDLEVLLNQLLAQNEVWQQTSIADILAREINPTKIKKVIALCQKMTPEISIAYNLMQMEAWEEAQTMLSQIPIENERWRHSSSEIAMAQHLLSAMRQESQK
jgi:hypothetical protein